VVGCWAIAVVAYLWATSLVEAQLAYRSPLRGHPPQPGSAAFPALTRRLVFVLIDGLRLDSSLDPQVMPVLNKLRSQGAWATMHSRAPSYSAPAYGVLMLGAWPDTHDGPAWNMEYEDMPTWTQDSLFSALYRAGMKSAISGYYWFEKLVPQEMLSASYYTPEEDAAADRQVVDAAIPWLRQGDYQFVLVHLDQVDYAGHQNTALSPQWDEAARNADDLLGEIVAALDLSRDTVLVASDHGHLDQGGHGGSEIIVVTEPFVLTGAGVNPGSYPDVQMVDVAPTMAVLLGVNIPAVSQGHVLSQMLELTPEQSAALQEALAAQQSELRRAFEAATGLELIIDPDIDIVDATSRAMDAVRQPGRLGRLVLAGMLLFALVGLLWAKRSQVLLQLIAGAALYALLFNIGYSILLNRTFSMSSARSVEDFILSNLLSAAAALTLAWLAFLGVTRLYQSPPLHSAEMTLALAYACLFLLFIPILWHLAYNGVRSTLTLPEQRSMFLALQSALQMLLVGGLGPLLSGAAASVSFSKKG
jgi:hypothetical protein